MAKGPIVTTEVEAFIASVYQKHPKWKASEVRNEVSHILHKNNPKLPSRWPSLSTIQKVLAIVRKNMKEKPADPRDKPWSTASIAKYPIHAEALPSILQLWVWTRENLDIEFSVRQAQWAARLYTVIKDIPTLSFISRIYAFTEINYEQIGASFEYIHSVDLTMFGLITGQEITPERAKKILGQEEESLFVGITDEEWLDWQEKTKLIESHLGDGLSICTDVKNKREAQNERTHKATQ
jgi:hypothetical protein